MGIKSVVYHGSLHVKTEDSTLQLHRAGTLSKDISIAFYLSSFLLLVSLQFFFWITDKLLPFDLSILILDKSIFSFSLNKLELF